MNVETLVLNQHKIKARHKSTLGLVLVLVFVVVSASVVDCVTGGGNETAWNGGNSRRLNKRSQRLYDDKVQSYLSQFGYLPTSSDSAIGNLRTDRQLKEAVRNLQRFGNLPVTGVIDDATLSLMSKPRCGLPDTPSPLDRRRRRRRRRFILEGRKWDHTDLTWSLRTERIRNYDRGKVRSELARALKVWAKHSKLTFQEVNDDRADILVYFEKEDHNDGYPFDGRGKILGHAFFPGSGRGGDAHFDLDEDWVVDDTRRTPDDSDGILLYNVAKHEFGHSLGLSHSSVIGSLMFPWYREDTDFGDSWELPDDDVWGIQSLYGRKEEKSWARIPYYNAYPDPTTTTTTTRRADTYRPRHPSSYDPPPPRYPNLPRYTPPQETPSNPQDTPSNRPPPKHPNLFPEPPRKNPISPERHPPDRRFPERTPPNRFPDVTESPRKYPDIPRPPPPRTSGTSTPVPVPTRPTTADSNPDKPDTCDTNYDAIAVIRREVFVFKNKWMWRIGDSGVSEGYPVLIERLWGSLPHNFSKIDAVYERVEDSHIVFFIGRQYFVFDGARLLPGYPRALTTLGLPASLDHVDGAMVWGYNSKTYLFAGSQYWKLDDETGMAEMDYPRDMATWHGVENNIDDVFQWNDGATYFFKGKGFWKFNDYRMRVEKEMQSPSAQFWMKCPQTPPNSGRTHGGKYFPGGSSSGHRSASVVQGAAVFVSLLTVLFVI